MNDQVNWWCNFVPCKSYKSSNCYVKLSTKKTCSLTNVGLMFGMAVWVWTLLLLFLETIIVTQHQIEKIKNEMENQPHCFYKTLSTVYEIPGPENVSKISDVQLNWNILRTKTDKKGIIKKALE